MIEVPATINGQLGTITIGGDVTVGTVVVGHGSTLTPNDHATIAANIETMFQQPKPQPRPTTLVICRDRKLGELTWHDLHKDGEPANKSNCITGDHFITWPGRAHTGRRFDRILISDALLRDLSYDDRKWTWWLEQTLTRLGPNGKVIRL